MPGYNNYMITVYYLPIILQRGVLHHLYLLDELGVAEFTIYTYIKRQGDYIPTWPRELHYQLRKNSEREFSPFSEFCVWKFSVWYIVRVVLSRMPVFSSPASTSPPSGKKIMNFFGETTPTSSLNPVDWVKLTTYMLNWLWLV